MKRKPAEPIKNTVMDVMEVLAGKKPAFSQGAPQEWLKKVLTKRQMEHIKLNNFKKGVLYIHTDSSSWLYSLSLQKQELLERLSKLSGSVKDIRFQLGGIK